MFKAVPACILLYSWMDFLLFKKQKIAAHSPPFVSVCIILTLSHFIMWICMTSPLSLCTGARPEICLPPKNIRIPAQEGRLGFSAARAEGQRAGEERRGEERWRQQRRRTERKKRAYFFWAASQQPDSDRSASRLVPSVQWSRARGDCPVIGTALSIRKRGTGTLPSIDTPSPCEFLFWF